jgi:hypothetical protein
MAKQPSEYERTTARTDARDLDGALRELVREKALKVGIEDDPLGAGGEGVRTESQPVRSGGLFRRSAKPTAVTALIAGELLVVLTGAEGDTPTVLLYRLDEIDVAEFDSPLVEDTGIDLTGMPRGGTERHAFFLPVDEGADGTWFRDELRAATERARS